MFAELKSQRGFTLTELVIALAVVGIMAGAFTVTRSVVESAKVSSAVQAVETIAAMRLPVSDWPQMEQEMMEGRLGIRSS